MSLSFAQTLQDLQKMKSEYEKMKNQKSANFPSQIDEQMQRDDTFSANPNNATIGFNQEMVKMKDSLNQSLKHFGYDFFTKRDSVSFWENLPTPKNYLLGPGDELILSLWGQTQLRKSYTINREGNIYDDQVGLLSMVGKTIEQGEKYLKSNFGSVYSTLKGDKATTYIDLSIGKLRSINVNFVGEVSFPGVYPIHPFSNIIIGIIQAGGIDTSGSLRNIQIIRAENEEKITFDLYEYLINGKIKNNIQLRDQDIVLVPVKKSIITIDSSVVRPGIYEFKEGESVRELLDYAGGLSHRASSVLSIKRITPINDRKKSIATYKHIQTDLISTKKMLAQNGDHVVVRKIKENSLFVELIGIEKNQERFNFFEGMTLYNLLEISGILDLDINYLKDAYSLNAEISRRNPKLNYEEIISINFVESISNINESKKIILKNEDRLIIYPNTFFKKEQVIKIEGQVIKPGSYTISQNQEKLKSLIERAGGFAENALYEGVSIYRQKKYYEKLFLSNQNNYYVNNMMNEIGNPDLPSVSENKVFEGDDNRIRLAWKDENVILMPGDSIVVRERTNTVNILGEVYNPGLQEFQKNRSLKYYLNSAGGITENGSKDKVIVVYANGQVKPKKWFSIPEIRDGCTIIVYAEKSTEPFNVTQFATNWTSILSSLITAVILSQQISPQ